MYCYRLSWFDFFKDLRPQLSKMYCAGAIIIDINRANEIMIWAIQNSYKSAWQDAARLVERLAMHHPRV
jgi:hypothetical protein